LATTLAGNGAEVIAMDRNPDLVEELRDDVTLAVRLDSTSEDALKAQGVGDVDVAIVGIGEDFESAALTVATLKSLGVPKIFARAETDVQAKILARIGADAIINPERESASRWAHRLTLPNLRQYVELGEGHSMIYMVAPRTFHGKTLREVHLRAKYGVNLVAIQRTILDRSKDPSSPAALEVVAVPTAETTILPDDVLVLVGSNEALAALPGG
jgi:trk system potassium uptake protein TrkA